MFVHKAFYSLQDPLAEKSPRKSKARTILACNGGTWLLASNKGELTSGNDLV